jgi:hypothetical protein|tara:strand:- start:848 stop:1201 length:354 start_codon:yes stop_codon:yes gene_type:complete
MEALLSDPSATTVAVLALFVVYVGFKDIMKPILQRILANDTMERRKLPSEQASTLFDMARQVDVLHEWHKPVEGRQSWKDQAPLVAAIKNLEETIKLEQAQTRQAFRDALSAHDHGD